MCARMAQIIVGDPNRGQVRSRSFLALIYNSMDSSQFPSRDTAPLIPHISSLSPHIYSINIYKKSASVVEWEQAAPAPNFLY
jgi:hypothetical protein